MTESMQLAKNGWRQEEIDMLWQEIRDAAETGTPLRGVFERMGETLGRKPNSIRNYYYMQLRSQAGDDFQRAAPFETFSEEEVHDLLRQVLMARGLGKSVRACVTEMAGGDRALMLRYQNKYRSILRKRPQLLRKICEELQQEGLPFPEFTEENRKAPGCEGEISAFSLQDSDILEAVRILEKLEKRLVPPGVTEHDRLKVQKDLLLMQLEDLQLAARDVIHCCKEFLGETMEERAERLPAFCDELTGHVTKMENLAQ